jgi:hypothetical protein
MGKNWNLGEVLKDDSKPGNDHWQGAVGNSPKENLEPA